MKIGEMLSAEMFDHLFDTLTDGVYISQKGIFKYVNRAMAKLFGYSCQEMVGLTAWNLAIPSQREWIRDEMFRKVRENDFDFIDVTCTKKDGSLVAVEINISRTPDSESRGNDLIFGIVHDMTEKKKSEDLLNRLIDNFPVAIQVFDVDGNTLRINKMLQEMYKLPSIDSFTGLFNILTDPLALEANLHLLFNRAIAGEAVFAENVRLPFSRIDAGWSGLHEDIVVNINIIPLTSETGVVDYVISAISDMTQTHAIAGKLRDSEERFKIIVESVGDGIGLVDRDEKIVYANPAFHDIFGVPLGALNGKTLREFVTDETFEKMKRETLKRIAGERSEYTIEIVRPDGTKRIVKLNATPHSDEHGAFVETFGIIHDITDEIQTHDELVRAMHLAEQGNRTKSEFLANMSHEIRTPMNGIVGMLELALADGLNARQKTYIISARESSFALLAILNDILDFSRLESSQFRLEDISFNVHELVWKSSYLMSPKAFEKKVELVCNIDPEFPKYLMGDPTRIRQILINLLSNAIKFTDHGEISVSLRPAVEKGFFDIIVKDTGIGIADDKKEIIFEMFTQADSSSSRRYGGTGLGLAVVRKLTELMKGYITVESMEGKGSVFSITLPLIIDEDTGKLFPFKVPESMKSQKPIIALENKSQGEALERIITFAGMNVSKSLADAEPGHSLIFIDMLGDADAMKLKQITGNTGNEIVAVLSENEKNHFALPSGAGNISLHILTKPFYPESIAELLDKIATGGATSPATPVEQGETTLPGNGEPVLVAEDSELNMMILKRYLEHMNYRVLPAVDGFEAISRYQEEVPAIVFLDIRMPGMDGFEVARKIRDMERQNTSPRRVPIIGISADIVRGVVEKSYESGMDAFLSKPFRQSDILAMMQRFLHPDSISERDLEREPAQQESAVFDREGLLNRVGNDENFMKIILDTFRKLFPEYAQLLESTLAAKDRKRTAEIAHKIRGMCGNAGAQKVEETAANLMRLASDQSTTDAELRTLFDSLMNNYQAFCRSIAV